MHNISSKKHNQDDHYDNQGQNDNTAHSTTTLLHVYLCLLYVCLRPLDIPIGISHLICNQVNLLPLLKCQDPYYLQQLDTLVDLLLKIEDFLPFCLDILESIGEERRALKESFCQLFLVLLAFGDLLVEFQLQVDLILDSPQ